MNAKSLAVALVVICAACLLLVAAPAPVSAATGTFCVSGAVSHVSNQRDPTGITTTQCGQLTTTIAAVAVDLDSSSRVYIYKGFSPDNVLCAARNLQVGQSVTFCGNLSGYLLNAGTINEASGWNLYPQTITVTQSAGRRPE